MKKTISLFSLFILLGISLKAQMPNPALVGYWHNWNDANAPYIQLDATNNNYNVIEIAFAAPTSASDMTMLFTPEIVSQNVFIAKVHALQIQGKKVLISIGGANSTIDLTSTINKNAFVSSMTAIINTYTFIDSFCDYGCGCYVYNTRIIIPIHINWNITIHIH